MRFGVHIRIDKGLARALERARELGCEAVQLFSSNPNAWRRKAVDVEAAAAFAGRARELNIHPIILHTPYLLNLAAPDDAIFAKSKDALADAVARAPYLGADLVVTHIGSHRGTGFESGVARICDAVRFALGSDDRPTIALELGSGAGNSIGSTFEEIARIIECMPDAAERIGVCIDTAHLWGAGYDVSTRAGVRETFAKLDRLIGLDSLRVIHLNDTLVERGSHRDRHWHIGEGRIGLRGFRAIANYPGTRDLPGIIETPAEPEEMDSTNLGVLRRLRDPQQMIRVPEAAR